jgi:hypothetical protein
VSIGEDGGQGTRLDRLLAVRFGMGFQCGKYVADRIGYADISSGCQAEIEKSSIDRSCRVTCSLITSFSVRSSRDHSRLSGGDSSKDSNCVKTVSLINRPKEPHVEHSIDRCDVSNALFIVSSRQFRHR